MSQSVRVVEVGPRDGLQNESAFVSTDTKLALIGRLVDAGLKNIEATSFVSPKWVPQMSDHAEIMAGLNKCRDISYSVLTPNLKGFQAAVASGANEVAVFSAASERFSQKNINCSIDESLQRFSPIFKEARQMGVKVRGYVSCVVGCPYEGAVDPDRVARVADQLYQSGCHEISLGDTVGVGNPESVTRMLEAVARRVPVTALSGHYHDTFGTALLNIHTSYQFGLRVFDSSIGGLGGCPYARGASGNVATEDVVYLMNSLGIETDVDLGKLIDTSIWISGQLNRTTGSKVTRAMMGKCPV